MAPIYWRSWRLVTSRNVPKRIFKEADANYEKAKAELKDLQANFNAAFESSAEKDNWTAGKWIADNTAKSIWSIITSEFD